MIVSSKMVILKYKESLITSPRDAYWVYDVCAELPEWSEVTQDYIFRRKPKRVSAKEAKELIKEHGLVCVCNNEFGKIYL